MKLLKSPVVTRERYFSLPTQHEHKTDPFYKKRVLEMLEQALKCGERSIRMRQTKRESPKKQARNSKSEVDGLRFPVPVENDDEPPLTALTYKHSYDI